MKLILLISIAFSSLANAMNIDITCKTQDGAPLISLKSTQDARSNGIIGAGNWLLKDPQGKLTQQTVDITYDVTDLGMTMYYISLVEGSTLHLHQQIALVPGKPIGSIYDAHEKIGDCSYRTK